MRRRSRGGGSSRAGSRPRRGRGTRRRLRSARCPPGRERRGRRRRSARARRRAPDGRGACGGCPLRSRTLRPPWASRGRRRCRRGSRRRRAASGRRSRGGRPPGRGRSSVRARRRRRRGSGVAAALETLDHWSGCCVFAHVSRVPGACPAAIRNHPGPTLNATLVRWDVREADRRQPPGAARLPAARAVRGRPRPDRDRGQVAPRRPGDARRRPTRTSATARRGCSAPRSRSTTRATARTTSRRAPRKLLLHRREIDSLYGQVREKGLTLVPTRLYFKDGRVKVELAVARGKEQRDKRRDVADRDAKRQMERALKAHTAEPGYTWATNIRGRHGFDVVGSPAELQAEVSGRPRKTTGKQRKCGKQPRTRCLSPRT